MKNQVQQDEYHTDIISIIVDSLKEYIQSLGCNTTYSNPYQPYTILVYHTSNITDNNRLSEIIKGYSNDYFASIHCSNENIIVATYTRFILNYEDPNLLDQIANRLNIAYTTWPIQ